MSDWIFTAPECWRPLDETQSPAPWGDKDLETVMDRAGYRPGDHSGEPDIEYLGSWACYCAQDPTLPYQYMLLLGLPDGRFTRVWCPALPDLMAYMARYHAIGQHSLDRAYLERLDEALRRLFRAWHGHDASSFCRDCDPQAYEYWQRRQAVRQAAQEITV
jgi:hypothetical protein